LPFDVAQGLKKDCADFVVSARRSPNRAPASAEYQVADAFVSNCCGEIDVHSNNTDWRFSGLVD